MVSSGDFHLSTCTIRLGWLSGSVTACLQIVSGCVRDIRSKLWSEHHRAVQNLNSTHNISTGRIQQWCCVVVKPCLVCLCADPLVLLCNKEERMKTQVFGSWKHQLLFYSLSTNSRDFRDLFKHWGKIPKTVNKHASPQSSSKKYCCTIHNTNTEGSNTTW